MEAGRDKHSLRRRRLKVAGFVLLGLLLVYALGLLVAAKLFLQPWRVSVHRPEGVAEVTVPTRYGLVPSWVTSNFKTSPVIFILADGYGGSRQTWVPLIPELQKAGYGAVVLSMNGHDASPDPSVGFGTKEAHTIAETVDWVRKQRLDHPKIVLLGLSMGGAACWLSTEINPSVDAVVTDCAFADFSSAMKDWFKVVPGSGVVLAPAVWMARAESGLDPAKIRPVDAARKWRGRPALIIRAGADHLISPRHATDLSLASGAPIWDVPHASHAKCFNQDMAGYMRHLQRLVSQLGIHRKREQSG